MPDSNSSSVTGAVRSDGFVDFYQLLGVSSTVSTEELRTRINDLYNEAQANRNHRQIEKRREYETLLEYLPQARTVLLEPDKRARYDSYAADARSGSPSTDFSSFMRQMSSKTMADPDRVDVLGVATDNTMTRADREKEKATATKTARKKGPSERARTSLMGTAISVILAFFIMAITYALKQDLIMAALIGGLVGVIAWLITHRPSDKIST